VGSVPAKGPARCPVVVPHERCESGTETEMTHILGNVSGRACLIVDDRIPSGGTMAISVTALLEAGVRPGDQSGGEAAALSR
jgi:phosphoribosylpyrophosphate synthetase